jgi:AraC-like DNA-binding protein
MAFGLAPVLDRHRIFGSGDVEETRAFLSTKQFHLELSPRDAGRLDARFNGVYMPGMYLGYIHYGPSVSVRATTRDDYWLQLPLTGQLEVANAKRGVICDTRRAAIASPCRNDYYLVRSDEGCGGIRVSFFKSELLACLASLLGEEPRVPLEFAPEIDVSSGYGRSLAQYLMMAVRDIDNAGTMPWNSAIMTAFEQFIMTMVLTVQPHNYSAALRRLDTPLAPRDVKRAIDYMHANLDASITITEIIAVAGVPGRTLFKHFRDFKGMSPMQYLRNARFDRVRRALLLGEPAEGITQIAMEAGFLHLGRFAVDYRRRFGESPSDTLRRRKGASR